MTGQKKYQDINRFLNQELENKKVLVAVHRGTWGGNIIENTIPSYELSRNLGADLFECDLSLSTDGKLYCFHDGGEPRLFGRKENIKTLKSEEIEELIYLNSLGQPSGYHVTRFEEVLEHFTNGELFNIDRSWWFLPEVDAAMRQYPHAIFQAVIKTPVTEEYLDFFSECPNKYMYMPIAYSMEDVRRVLARSEINTVGVEAIAASQEDELFREENIRWIREQGLYVWVNTINLSGKKEHVLYGGLDDDTALLKNPDDTWGVLADRAVNVMQTDWPYQMKQYLSRKVK